MPAPLNLALVRALSELCVNSSSDASTTYRRSDANPFRITSFADPYPLTTIESHLYKKHGGGGHPHKPSPFLSASLPRCFFFLNLKGNLDV